MIDDYFRQYGLIAILAIVAIAMPTGMIMASWLLSRLRVRPSKPSPIKGSIYECGVETFPRRWTQFNARYYMFAILFLVFEVLAVFLYPWAIQFGVLSVSFGIFVLIEMFVFIAILGIAWIYAWRVRALEWK